MEAVAAVASVEAEVVAAVALEAIAAAVEVVVASAIVVDAEVEAAAVASEEVAVAAVDSEADMTRAHRNQLSTWVPFSIPVRSSSSSNVRLRMCPTSMRPSILRIKNK